MEENDFCCRFKIDENLIENAKNLLSDVDISIKEKSKIFALLGNDVRLKIIILFLQINRMCVCDLSDVLGMNQSPISQHLRKLKDGGLLENKREGMTIFYYIPLKIKKILSNILEFEMGKI